MQLNARLCIAQIARKCPSTIPLLIKCYRGAIACEADAIRYVEVFAKVLEAFGAVNAEHSAWVRDILQAAAFAIDSPKTSTEVKASAVSLICSAVDHGTVTMLDGSQTMGLVQLGATFLQPTKIEATLLRRAAVTLLSSIVRAVLPEMSNRQDLVPVLRLADETLRRTRENDEDAVVCTIAERSLAILSP